MELKKKKKNCWVLTAAMKLKYAWQRKAMTKLDRILKNRDIAEKIYLVKDMGFPVVM